MKFNILTLFPEMFEALNHSIIARAKDKGRVELNLLNIRDYSTNKHKKVDAYPYGGGAGMVMQVQPIYDALESLEDKGRVVYLTPKGKTLDQALLIDLSKASTLTLLCGHYEGVDQRIIDACVTDEISAGDYVLTGGELPAMLVVDGVSRLLEGVLAKDVSFEDESHYSGLLEYPHYTRPAQILGREVPEVLMSGNHKAIEEYRLLESLKLTRQRRPDMFELWLSKDKSKAQVKFLKKYMDIPHKK